MKSRPIRISVLGLIPVALLVAACNNPYDTNPSSSTTASTSVAPTTAPNGDNKVATVGFNGNVALLPVVSGTSLVKGDSTKFADTPPVGSEADRKKCGLMSHWSQLVACMGDKAWYRDGFTTMNPYAASCGMNSWNDVLRYAAARVNGQEIDARVIQVMNDPNMSEADARAAARELIGKDADNTQIPVINIAKHNPFVNSRGLEQDKVSPFVDKKPQVRVTLAPIMFDSANNPANLCGDGGVFIDCLNIWGIPQAVAPAPGQPVVCPPGTAMAGKPAPTGGCNPPPLPPSGTGTPPPPTPPSGTGTPPPPTSPPPPTTTVPPTTTQPPVTTTPQCPPGTTPPGCTVPKTATEQPGAGGAGDGGASEYGGMGGDPPRTAETTDKPPAAQQPPPVYTPPPAVPAPASPAPNAPTPTHGTPPPIESGTGGNGGSTSAPRTGDPGSGGM